MDFLSKLRKLGSKSTLRNGAFFSIFSFINKGFSFFLLLILANYIIPSEYGYLSLFSTILMVLGFFTAMSTEGYLSIAYFNDHDDIENTFSGIFYISVIMCSFFLLFILIGGDYLVDIVNLPSEFLILSVAISFTTLFANVNLDYLRLKENIKVYGILSCGNALLNFFVSIVLVKYFYLGWKGRVYAQSSCFFLFGIVALIYFLSKGYLRKPNWQYIKGMLVWGVPLIPHLATNFIRQGCDRYIINDYHSIADVGLFSFALNLVNIITMVGFGFNQSNSVDIYRTLGNKELNHEVKLSKLAKTRKKIISLYICSSLIITILCYFLVPFLLPQYNDALGYFLVLAIYGFLVCMYLVYTNYLFFLKKTKSLMTITFISSLFHLGLSLWLTKYSLYYTAILYVFTQLFVVIAIRWYGKIELTKIKY